MLDLWYKNAVIYCVDADAFMDSDGDGGSNGAELGDPDGIWVVGDPDPANPFAPGDPESTPPLPTAIETSSWAQIKTLINELD